MKEKSLDKSSKDKIYPLGILVLHIVHNFEMEGVYLYSFSGGGSPPSTLQEISLNLGHN